MASFNNTAFLLVLLFSIILINHQVKCNGEEDNLLQGINKYRKALNLTAFAKNENAACLAGEIADQFKDQPCTNSTGANTIPGTENQFPNYPDMLDHCHLNISDTRDGTIMPACVPSLDPSLVLTNFTKSQYSGSLNDTKYTGAGISSSGNWMVVVLTTDSAGGSFEPSASTSFVFRPSHLYQILMFFMACLML